MQQVGAQLKWRWMDEGQGDLTRGLVCRVLVAVEINSIMFINDQQTWL